MAGRFWGTHPYKVDGKGRVSVPPEFRPVVEQGDPTFQGAGTPPRLFAVPDLFRLPCLTCLTLERMDALAAAADASGDPAMIDTFDVDVAGRAVQLKLDDSNRLLLSPEFRAAFGITTDATFVGKRDRFEIWEPGALAAFLAEREADAESRAASREKLRQLFATPVPARGAA